MIRFLSSGTCSFRLLHFAALHPQECWSFWKGQEVVDFIIENRHRRGSGDPSDTTKMTLRRDPGVVLPVSEHNQHAGFLTTLGEQP